MSIVAGSVLNKLCRGCATLGPTIDTRLAALNAPRREFYSKSRVEHRMPDIRLVNLTARGQADDWSVLHGPTVKAANSRALSPWLVELADLHFATSTGPQKQKRRIGDVFCSLS